MREFGKPEKGRRREHEGEWESPVPPAPSNDSEEGDVEIQCVDCGIMFVFTSGERKFFLERIGPDFRQPRRCKACRDLKKSKKQSY